MAPGVCYDAGRVAERKRITVIRTRTQTGKSLCFCFFGGNSKEWNANKGKADVPEHEQKARILYAARFLYLPDDKKECM